MYLRDEEEEDLEVQQFVGVITKAALRPSLFYEGNIGPAGVLNSRPPACQPGVQPTEPPVRSVPMGNAYRIKFGRCLKIDKRCRCAYLTYISTAITGASQPSNGTPCNLIWISYKPWETVSGLWSYNKLGLTNHSAFFKRD